MAAQGATRELHKPDAARFVSFHHSLPRASRCNLLPQVVIPRAVRRALQPANTALSWVPAEMEDFGEVIPLLAAPVVSVISHQSSAHDGPRPNMPSADVLARPSAAPLDGVCTAAQSSNRRPGGEAILCFVAAS